VFITDGNGAYQEFPVKTQYLRKRAELELDNISREKRLRWLVHVVRMNYQHHIPQQALYWEVQGIKKGWPGRPRTNCSSMTINDLQKISLRCKEEAEVATVNRRCRIAAKRIHSDVG